MKENVLMNLVECEAMERRRSETRTKAVIVAIGLHAQTQELCARKVM